MPYETRAEIERERDELRNALEGILDRVTDALDIEEEEEEQENEAEDDDD